MVSCVFFYFLIYSRYASPTSRTDPERERERASREAAVARLKVMRNVFTLIFSRDTRLSTRVQTNNYNAPRGSRNHNHARKPISLSLISGRISFSDSL